MEVVYGGDKTAWTIYFEYKEHPYAISLLKSGLVLFGEEVGKSEVGQLLNIFRRSIKVIYDIYKGEINTRIKQGKITIQNSTTWLLERFYFNVDLFNRIKDGSYQYRKYFIKEVQLMFAFISISDAFFSWLEHICVLLLALSGFDPIADDIFKFIRLDWTKKYNRIFVPTANRKYAVEYGKLKRIKEEIRNTYAHGGIRTTNSEILVHWKGLGAIPYNLSGNESYPNIKYKSLDYNYSIDIEAMNAFVLMMQGKGSMSLKYKLIESGLDISFSSESIRAMLEAIKNKEKLDNYLERECNRQDAIDNYEL